MNTLANFFLGKGVVKPYRPIRTYLTEITEWDSDDEYIEKTYNILTGVLDFNIVEALSPSLEGIIEYDVFINSVKVDGLSGTSWQIEGLETIYGKGVTDVIYGGLPYIIQVNVTTESKSLGVTSVSTVGVINFSNELTLAVDDEVYEVIFTPISESHRVDLEVFNYKWKLDKQILPLTVKSYDLNGKYLATLTDKIDVRCSVELTEITKLLETSVITIERNKYEIDTTLIQVVNGIDLFHNVNVTHNALGKHVVIFVDNKKINETHFNSFNTIGKLLTVVLTSEDIWVEGDSFDRLEVTQYINFTEEVIKGTTIDEISKYFINNTVGNKLTNTGNSDISVSHNIPNRYTYTDIANLPESSLPFNLDYSRHNGIYILKHTETPDKKVGELFKFLEEDASVSLNVYGSELNRVTVTDSDLHNEDNVLNSNNEYTSSIEDVEDLKEYFNDDTLDSKLVMDSYSDISFITDDTIILHKDFEDLNILQLELSLNLDKIGNTPDAKITVTLTDSGGAVIRRYGFIRQNDTTVVYLTDKTNYKINNPYYTFNELYRLTNLMGIAHMYIEVKKGQSFKFSIKKLIVTSRRT